MRIKELRCDQFAGLTDRLITFTDGLNIVVGPNESGKSTLIDLIYHMFFKDAMLDGRRDKDFKDVYFPRSTGTYQGDTIDGVLKFETADGVYRLSKEWSGKDGRSKLTLPDGTTIRDRSTINSILLKALEYGRGIYDELIFDSQKRGHTVLRAILNGENSDTTGELSTILKKAVMETGGMDIDKIGSRLEEIISGYGGHWDFDKDMPDGGRKRGINNPWVKGVGSVLKAYYEKETVAQAQKDAEKAEKDVERINSDIRLQREIKKCLDVKKTEFARVRSLISEFNDLKALIGSKQRELSEMSTALEEWPAALEGISRAKELLKKHEQAFLFKLYNDIKPVEDKLEANEKILANSIMAEKADVTEAEALQKSIDKLQSKLEGMDISAKIIPYGKADVQVKAISSGESIADRDGKYDITEAVSISVPGVVDIHLMPKGVNVDEIRSEISAGSKRLKELLDKYRLENAEQLKSLFDEQKKLAQENEILQSRMLARLNGASWEAIKKGVPQSAPSLEEVDAEIKKLCGKRSPEAYIGVKEDRVKEYTAKYESVEHLSGLAASRQSELEKDSERLRKASAIPEEFSAVTDPDAYENDLSVRIEACDGEIDMLRAELSAAERSLGDKSAEEYSEEYSAKNSEFEEKKETCKRWMHIHEVFTALRNEMKGDPMVGIEKYFTDYLAKLSGGNISVQGMNDDLETKIVSKNHPLVYQILSEGTKDTISLAFRLAVLDHLYPDGGCVAVFDDPFTDMDPERVSEACGLIQKFAERNQVLFITCDNKYCNVLEGNIISVA